MPAARALLPSVAVLGLLAGAAYAFRTRLRGALPRRRSGGETFRCDCGHTLRVTGAGRHRIYFNGDDALLENACPSCDRPLPAS